RFLSYRSCLLLISLGTLLGIIGCSGNESKNTSTQNSSGTVEANSKNPLTNLKEAATVGKSLYATNCALCHGDSGKGDGPAGTALAAKPTDLTTGDVTQDPDGELFLVIKNGKMTDGKLVMPPVKQLSDKQIWEIVTYVRTLSQK